MATENNGMVLAFEAGADLSALQHYIVKLNSSRQVVAVTAITDIPLGILQNKPDASGKEARVCVSGTSKVVLGGTLAAGAIVGTGTGGKAVADASTNYNVGQLLAGGADTEKGEVLLGSLTATA